MLCSKVLGNIKQPPASVSSIDPVNFTWSECLRQSLRKRSHAGREIKILLSAGSRLRDGDILGIDGGVAAIVRALPAEVLVVKPESAQQMGELCFEIGNLHLPAEIREDEIAIARSRHTEELLKRLDVRFEAQTRIFQPMPAAGAHSVQLADTARIERGASGPLSPTGGEG